jgi:membrane fusion protein
VFDFMSAPEVVDHLTDLFRAEARFAATSRFGYPVRPLGVGTVALTAFFTALLACLILFLTFGRYARKETVPGVIQPAQGSAAVTMLSSGVIAEVMVTEGQTVAEGAPILRFAADPRVSKDGARPVALSGLITEGAKREADALSDQADAEVRAVSRSLDDLRARRSGLRADQENLTKSLALQSERVRLLEATLAAGRTLYEQQLFAALQLRQREEAVIAARQGLGALERQIRQNQALLEQADAEEGRLQAQRTQSRAEVARARAQFDQRRAEQLAAEGTVVVASRPGRVVALQARAGATALSGQAVAVILPEGAPLQAELWVPSRAAGFVRVGTRVRLMYDSFPYQKFGVGHGRVISVAGAPTNPKDLPVPIETREALYRIVVRIDDAAVNAYGRKWALAPGMRLAADMILDERNLWEWLLDPLIAAKRRSES